MIDSNIIGSCIVVQSTDLYGSKNDAVRCPLVFTIVVERLENQLGRRGRGEVEADHFQVGQRSQGREEGHRLAAARRPAQHHGLVVG